MPELWYPDAERRDHKMPGPVRPLITRGDLVLMWHTMVWDLESCAAYFESHGTNGVFSHLGVGHDGRTFQWGAFNRWSAAALDGNPRAITVETADRGEGFPDWDPSDGSAVPAWTDAQMDRNVDIAVFASRELGIPCVLLPDSRPGRSGHTYHRQGVDPYRVDGGELWSRSYGKVCPGNRRIAQIPEVIKRAQAILAGGEDDMSADAERKIAELYDHLLGLNADGKIRGVGPGQATVGGTIAATLGGVQNVFNAVADVKTAVGKDSWLIRVPGRTAVYFGSIAARFWVQDPGDLARLPGSPKPEDAEDEPEGKSRWSAPLVGPAAPLGEGLDDDIT